MCIIAWSLPDICAQHKPPCFRGPCQICSQTAQKPWQLQWKKIDTAQAVLTCEITRKCGCHNNVMYAGLTLDDCKTHTTPHIGEHLTHLDTLHWHTFDALNMIFLVDPSELLGSYNGASRICCWYWFQKALSVHSVCWKKPTICFVMFSHGPDDSRILLSVQLNCWKSAVEKTCAR